MEAAGAVSITASSVKSYDVRCTQYHDNGDSKAFKVVGIQRQKLQCVGHIQKRLGSCLCRSLRDYKWKKFDDGEFLTGQGTLTEKETDKRITMGKQL
jgi:hypothetical protein